MKKGLRLMVEVPVCPVVDWNEDLMKKGLRHPLAFSYINTRSSLERRPYEEGIATISGRRSAWDP